MCTPVVQRQCACLDESCGKRFWITRRAWSECFDGFCPYCGADAIENMGANDVSIKDKGSKLESNQRRETGDYF